MERSVMKKIFFIFLLLPQLWQSFGCLPIEARWEKLPISICVENEKEANIVSDFNTIAKFNFYEITKNNCQVIMQTVTSPLANNWTATTDYEFTTKTLQGLPLLKKAKIRISKSIYDKYDDESTISFFRLENIIAHEMGHALGHIYHTPPEKTRELMREPYVYTFLLSDLMTGDFKEWLHSTYPEVYRDVE